MSNKIKRKNKDAKAIKEQRIKRESVYQTSDLIVAVSTMVLHDKFGFGKIRLERYLVELYNLMDSVRKGYCSISDLFLTLKQETGIDFSKF